LDRKGQQEWKGVQNLTWESKRVKEHEQRSARLPTLGLGDKKKRRGWILDSMPKELESGEKN